MNYSFSAVLHGGEVVSVLPHIIEAVGSILWN